MSNLGRKEQEIFRSFADKVKYVKDQSPGEMLQMLQEEVGQHVDEEAWMGQAHVRIGVIGMSGSGKSTFINSFRGLKVRDPEAAAPDTTETEEYPDPHHKNVILVDFPGTLFRLDGGSWRPVTFDVKEYTKKFGEKMDECNVFLVFTSGRIHGNAVWIARKAKEIGKKVLFVRSKFDLDVQNMKRDDPDYFEQGEEKGEERLLREQRQDYVSKLETMGFGRADGSDVFIISGILDNIQRGRWDAPALKEAILKQLDIQQKMLFITTCQNYSPTMVRAKAEMYRSRAWKVAVGVATFGIIRFRCIRFAGAVINLGMMVTTAKLFKRGFGLDSASVGKLAALSGKSAMDLQRVVDKKLSFVNKIVQFLSGDINRQSLKVALLAAGICGVLVVDATIDTAIPFFGGVVTAPASFGLAWYALHLIIGHQEQCARALHEKAFG